MTQDKIEAVEDIITLRVLNSNHLLFVGNVLKENSELVIRLMKSDIADYQKEHIVNAIMFIHSEAIHSWVEYILSYIANICNISQELYEKINHYYLTFCRTKDFSNALTTLNADMKQELYNNREKGNFLVWEPTTQYLINELNHHVGKLIIAIAVGDKHDIKEYSADVANYLVKARMIYG